VTAQPRLKAGAEPGTTDLLVDTARSARFTGNVSFDNAGNVFAGRERFIGTASVLAPFHQGDTLSVTLLGGPEDLTRYGTVEYEALLDGHGLRAGVSFEALDYALGDTLAKLGARGDVQTGTAWLKRPLVRSQSRNLYAQLEAEYVSLDDEIAANQTRTARHLAGDVDEGLRTTILEHLALGHLVRHGVAAIGQVGALPEVVPGEDARRLTIVRGNGLVAVTNLPVEASASLVHGNLAIRFQGSEDLELPEGGQLLFLEVRDQRRPNCPRPVSARRHGLPFTRFRPGPSEPGDVARKSWVP
jgi:hemolysin activation/secretion protein